MTKDEKNQPSAPVVPSGPDANPDAGTNQAKTAQQQEAAKRGWRDVIGERNPDLNLDDDAAVGDYLSNGFKNYDSQKDELEKSKGYANQISETINKEPLMAAAIDGLTSGIDEDGNEFSLANFLMNEFYDEIKASSSSEEAKEMIAKKLAKKEEQAAKDAADKEAKSKLIADNIDKSDKALDEAAEEIGADDATKKSMTDWLWAGAGTENPTGFAFRLAKMDLNKEDFINLLFAFNRDAELGKAHKAGVRDASMRQRGSNHRRNAAPTDLGGGRGSEMETAEPEDPTIRAYGGMKPRFQ